MNNHNGDIQQKVAINATEIVSKYRNIKDRINFCFEKNWYHPKEVGFDANFFLMVLKGEKKYLPNNFTINYDIGYFRQGEKLDKRYLIERMKLNSIYALYTPNISDPMKFSKKFLLKLIAFVDPELFKELYSINKKQIQERCFNNWGNFKIDIAQDYIDDINNFKSISNDNKNYGGFRRYKNHQLTNIFYQFKGNQENRINQVNSNKNIIQQNQQLQQKLEQVNQSNNMLMSEKQMLKKEIISLQNKINEKNDKNIKDDIIMVDNNNGDKHNFVVNSGNICSTKSEHGIEEGNNACNNKILKIKFSKNK